MFNDIVFTCLKLAGSGCKPFFSKLVRRMVNSKI